MSAGKVLIVLSDANYFEFHKTDGSVTHEETGVFLQELTKPLQQMLDAGYRVIVRSSPNVRRVPG